MNNAQEPLGTESIPAHVLQSILQALCGMRFGQVTAIVHDGRVVQIDRTERQRFTEEKEIRN